MFQNYLQALSKEHTAVDSTLILAKDILIQHANQKHEKDPTCTSSSFSRLSEESAQNQEGLEQVALSVEFQDSMTQLHLKDKEVANIAETQDKGSATRMIDDGVDDINGCRKDGCEDHKFKEEAEQVKSAVEKYKLEQVQLKEQLLQELNQRKVIYTCSMDEFIVVSCC